MSIKRIDPTLLLSHCLHPETDTPDSLGRANTLAEREWAMNDIPNYSITSLMDSDTLPAEAEQMFAEELACSREPMLKDRADRDKCQCACVCAVTDFGSVLGGIHLDIGPINFGPLSNENMAFLEGIFVRPEHRNNGIATALMREALNVARDTGCFHVQASIDWNNPAAIALYKKSGFALTDISDNEDPNKVNGEYYAVGPLNI